MHLIDIFKKLDLVLMIFLSIFFTAHIFYGKLGLISNLKLQKNILELQKNILELQKQQKKLENEINYINKEINQDYLETLALQIFFKVPKNSRIIKLI